MSVKLHEELAKIGETQPSHQAGIGGMKKYAPVFFLIQPM
jgi:hypothetical protein